MASLIMGTGVHPVFFCVEGGNPANDIIYQNRQSR